MYLIYLNLFINLMIFNATDLSSFNYELDDPKLRLDDFNPAELRTG